MQLIEQASLALFPKTLQDIEAAHELRRPVIDFPSAMVVEMKASWNEFGSATAQVTLRLNNADASKLLSNTDYKMALISVESEGTIWRGLVKKMGWQGNLVKLEMSGAFEAVGRTPLTHFFSKTGFEGWREASIDIWGTRTPEDFNWFTKDDDWWGISPQTGHQYGNLLNSSSLFWNTPDKSPIYGACGDISFKRASADSDWKYFVILWNNEGTVDDAVYKTGTNFNSILTSVQPGPGRTGYWHNWDDASPGPTADVGNLIEIGIFRDDTTPAEYTDPNQSVQVSARDFRVWGAEARTFSINAETTQADVNWFDAAETPSNAKPLVPGQQVFIGPPEGTGQSIAYVEYVDENDRVYLDREVSYNFITSRMKWVMVPPSEIYKVVVAESALAAPGLILDNVDNIEAQAFDIPDSMYIKEDALSLMNELKSYGHHELTYKPLEPGEQPLWKSYRIYVDPESGQVIGEHTLLDKTDFAAQEWSLDQGLKGREHWMVGIKDFSLTQSDDQITEVSVVGETKKGSPINSDIAPRPISDRYSKGNPDNTGAKRGGVWAASGARYGRHESLFKMLRERLWRIASYRHTIARIKPLIAYSLGFQSRPLVAVRPGHLMTVHNVSETFTEGEEEAFSEIRIIETAYDFMTGEGALIPEADETDLSWVMVREEQQKRERGSNRRFRGVERRWWLR